jgi:hypothetical protein
MSYTLTLSGDSSILSSQFYPPIELEDDAEYVIGLTDFLAYHSIPNVDSTNNRFYYGDADKVIKIPEGSYEIEDINTYINSNLAELTATDTNLPDNLVFVSIKSNKNTLKCEIKANTTINFNKPNSIGRLLGYKNRKLKANKFHESNNPIKIQKVNAICVECNLVSNSFINGQPGHILHEFFPRVGPGYKIIDSPANVIYLPVNKRRIEGVTIKIVDQDGDLINFRGEVITLRLHLKRNGA